jgi:hypothetical protein
MATQPKIPTPSTTPNDDVLRLDKARWGLAITWLPSCAVLFLIFVIQSIAGAYGTQAQRAWGWALPTFLPTLALMISVFAADAFRIADASIVYVRRSFYRLSLGLSIFYLLIVFLSVLAQPFIGTASNATDLATARLELLELSNIWLSPLQSLVVAAIGVLFFLKEERRRR